MYNFRVRFFIHKYKISGHSMEPYLKEGDQVLALGFLKINVRDIVVFRYNSKNLVKRITRIKNNEVYFQGDNKSDSLKIPKIPKHDIIGKVILKI